MGKNTRCFLPEVFASRHPIVASSIFDPELFRRLNPQSNTRASEGKDNTITNKDGILKTILGGGLEFAEYSINIRVICRMFVVTFLDSLRGHKFHAILIVNVLCFLSP